MYKKMFLTVSERKGLDFKTLRTAVSYTEIYSCASDLTYIALWFMSGLQ